MWIMKITCEEPQKRVPWPIEISLELQRSRGLALFFALWLAILFP
jgi:hypothetical protein